MIGVRVNEILKYLSTDKDRLVKCVQAMESMHMLDSNNKSNLVNVLLSVSVNGESEEQEKKEDEEPDDGETTTVVSSSSPPATNAHDADKDIKSREKLKNIKPGDNEIGKDHRKRMPLTVLKCNNIQQRLSSGQIPISKNPAGFRPSSSMVPATSLPRDMKLNGFRYLAAMKAETPAAATPSPLASEDASTSELDSRLETSDATSALKDKEKQTAKKKNSKRKTVVSQEPESLSSEMEKTGGSREGVVDGNHEPVGATVKRLSPADSTSPIASSSRKNRKQNKNKDSACKKTEPKVADPCRREDVLPSTETPFQFMSDTLTNVTETQSSKLLSSTEPSHQSDIPSTKKLTSTQKSNNLKSVKCKGHRINGHTPPSGVAELDTFEVTSAANQKQAKKRAVSSSPNNEVNILETLDQPAQPSSSRQLNEPACAVSSMDLEAEEKWIEVNRKVKRIAVPSSIVDRIIGPDGRKLEAICHVTKANIELEKGSNPTETTFVLRGSSEQMQAAYSVIAALTRDLKPLDIGKATNGLHVKNGSRNLLGQRLVPLKPAEAGSGLRESSGGVKGNHSAVFCLSNEKTSPMVQLNDRDSDDLQSNMRSSPSEKSSSCSERCSPSHELLVGEYSLFEHGLGQPLEKLLSRKDSSKVSFAHAASNGNVARTVALVPRNRSMVDQTLLAKAPGYRNANTKLTTLTHEPRHQKLDFSMSHGQNVQSHGFRNPDGNTVPTRNSSSPQSASMQLICIDSSNVHIPSLERPMPASGGSGFPTLHSTQVTSIGDSQAVLPNHHLMQTFSKLNPNAPDFIFAMPPHPSVGQPGSLVGDVPEPSATGPECIRSNRPLDASYVPYAQLDGRYEPSEDISDLSSDGGGCPNAGFVAPGVGAEEAAMYMTSLGDHPNVPWLCSQVTWHASKLSYGVNGSEPVMAASAPPYSVAGDFYHGYFAHQPFSPMTSSPYNCAFYQQQHHHHPMLAVQSLGPALAQAAP